MTRSGTNFPGRSVSWACALGALALLPFAANVAAGGVLYYRDMFRTFLPVRLYVLQGLAHGELRYWNPYIHEGEPTSMLPLGYPVELLQVLAPSTWGISLTLILHVALAALAFAFLARSLGHSRLASLTGAIAYAWGGFMLSTLNLYFYVETAAWAPLVVWACRRALTARGLARLAPTLVIAVATSTQGLELLLQALLLGLLLARPANGRSALRLALCLGLGVGLCGYVLLPTMGLAQGSERFKGFSVEEMLGYPIHPLTLLQTLVANLHSDLGDLTNWFWGQRFVTRQSYFESLYLGPLTIVLALFGLARDRGRLLGGLCLAGALVCLGPHVRLDLVLAALPAWLRVLRYPAKAFFLVHLCVALLATAGLEALLENRRRFKAAAGGWLAFAAVVGLGAGALMTSAGARNAITQPLLIENATESARLDVAQRLGSDAVHGALISLAAGLVALAAALGRVAAPRAAAGIAILLAADLLRAGVGVNPMLPARRLGPSPESRELGARLREAHARALICDTDWLRWADSGPQRYEARVAAYAETLAPGFNLAEQVPTALSLNSTGHVPNSACLTAIQQLCRDLGAVTARLTDAGVTHVVATRELDVPGLRLAWSGAPARIAPLPVNVYTLEQPRPFVELATGAARFERVAAGALRLHVEAQAAGELLVRERWAPGWTAQVDGRPRPLLVGRRHLTVEVAPGDAQVDLRYEPPGLRAGIRLSLASLLALALLVAAERRGLTRASAPG